MHTLDPQSTLSTQHQRRLLVGLLLLLFAFVGQPGSVLACSMVQPDLDWMIRRSPVIAIGAVTEATDDTFTLEVREYLRGAPTASHLVVNNHRNSLVDPACNMELGPGGHLTVGNQIVAFLEPDNHNIGANWRFSDAFMEEFILIENSDIDGRFIAPAEWEHNADALDERRAQGLPWFFHANLEYPENSTAEVVRADILAIVDNAGVHEPSSGREEPAAISPLATRSGSYLPALLIGSACFILALVIFWRYQRDGTQNPT